MNTQQWALLYDLQYGASTEFHTWGAFTENDAVPSTDVPATAYWNLLNAIQGRLGHENGIYASDIFKAAMQDWWS